jgi:GT2 family glycosyltransferase
MRTKLSSTNIAESGAERSGEGTPDDQLHEIPGEDARGLIAQLQTMEISLAELRSRHQKLQADYAALVEQAATERGAFGQAEPAWGAEKETLADLSQANAALTEMVARLGQDIQVMSASLQSGKNELAQREGEIGELERRLKDAVREMRNGEEHTRQVMLELLRVRDQQQASQQLAEAAAVKATLAEQQREELRILLRKSESARLEMEQTPGWWLIEGFHDWMKRSPKFAKAIGFTVKAARGLRLLPTTGCTQEAQRIAPLVDEGHYFRTYPEAKAWGVPAAEHYLRLGASRGFNPSPVFNTEFYLTRYPDVASADMNPLLHYVDHGADEGRRTHPEAEEALGGKAPESLGKPLAEPQDPPPTPGLEAASDAAAPEYIKLPERFAVRPHREPVSIIVTVHNAIEYVRTCLNAILRNTSPPYELVLVDDGSEEETCHYLRRFATEQGALLIRNEAASGYTKAANQGLRAARGEYVLLLNSDTIVTENWLDRMVMCAESDPHIGIVGPLSNRAGWQSVPEVVRGGEWATNELPENWSVQDMARAVAATTGRTYPRIPFLNGFCLLIKRQVLEGVGYFDEVNFGRGYGEENDYCLRARAAGWVLSVADDAYVYHARTKSYSIERRDQLSEEAHRMLQTKHKRPLIDRDTKQVQDHLVLLGIRARTKQIFARQSMIAEGGRRWEGKRIAFVIPIGEQCAWGNVVLAEAKAMETFGASVLLVNLLANRPAFEAGYPELDLRTVFVPGGADVPDAVRGYDAIIATTYHSVFSLQCFARGTSAPSLGYYIQDFEPNFFPPGSAEHRAALSSCTLIPSMVRFTRTAWNRDELFRHAGVDCTVAGPSCDVDLFRPRVAAATGKVNVCAMVRPSAPRWAARETMEVLAHVDKQYGDGVAIHIFGVDSRDPLFLDLPRDFRWTNHDMRTREQMAALLSAQDIFADLSQGQAMGLTALEAMASGAAAVVPQTGGCGAFAVDGENALVVDTANRTACQQAIGMLIEDGELLAKIRRRALSDVARFWPERAAFSILNALFLESKQAPGGPPPSVSRVTAHA